MKESMAHLYELDLIQLVGYFLHRQILAPSSVSRHTQV